MAVLGVDVSKADFRCFLIDGEACAAEKFENKPAGYRDMLKWLQTQRSADVHVCMEATGAYWRPLANAVHAANLRVSVVNPSRTAHFSRSRLQRTKTDAVDAKMLADFCLTQKLYLWEPSAPEILELRAFLTYRKQLVAQRIAQEQLISQVEGNGKLRKIYAAQANAIAKALEAIEREMRAHVKAHHELQECVAHVQSIPGVGFLTAATIVAYLPVERLRNKKAASAYAGLSPREWQSGTSVHGKPRICKTGNADLREALYMPALVAMRFNPTMKTFADRQKAKGKPPKVTIVAIMRKLLVLAYTLLRDKIDFDPAKA
jgi:transposase